MTIRSSLLSRRLWLTAGTGLAIAAAVVACKIPNATDSMKKVLQEHGTIDGEWEVRDDAEEKTYTYVLLRNKTGTHETYEIVATDGQRNVTREMIGGIDGTGCFLLPEGMTSKWVMNQPPEVLEQTRVSGEKTYTRCLEYKGTEGWAQIPAKDRKAAEPPPPPPKPAVSPDAGTPDAGTPDAGEDDKGEVEGVPI